LAFNFDTSNPTDTFLIPSYPQNERNHRQAVSDMLVVEHDISDGRHQFGVGDDAARDAITTWQIGSIWFNTGQSPAYLQRVVSLGPITWENVDSRASVGHTNEQTDYTVAQFASFDQITPVTATVDTLAIDLSLSPSKYTTIVNDTLIQNPINDLTGKDVTIKLEMMMNASGGHTITWDTNYFTTSGVTPNVFTGPNERNMVYLSKTNDDKFLVSTSANIKAIV